MDLLNFKRTTETTRWRFNARILLVGERVVYRAWGGQPFVSEMDVQTNPAVSTQKSANWSSTD